MPAAGCPPDRPRQQQQQQWSLMRTRVRRSLELRNSMKALQEEQAKSFKSMVDLGSDFYVQAVVCVAGQSPSP